MSDQIYTPIGLYVCFIPPSVFTWPSVYWCSGWWCMYQLVKLNQLSSPIRRKMSPHDRTTWLVHEHINPITWRFGSRALLATDLTDGVQFLETRVDSNRNHRATTVNSNSWKSKASPTIVGLWTKMITRPVHKHISPAYIGLARLSRLYSKLQCCV